MGKQWKKGFKADNASKRGAFFTKFVKEIQVAAKLGGADPDANMRLRIAVDSAKAASCQKDTIEKAIKRGAGLLDDGKDIEELTYEGYGPHQVGVIVECQTDNRARTASEMRLLFGKAGGNLGELGSVAWMFDRIGLVEAKNQNEVDIEEEAIEAGAQEVEKLDPEDGILQEEFSVEAAFYTDHVELGEVRDALIARGWDIQKAELSYRPKTLTELTEDQKEEVYEFLNKVDDHDDSHRVHASLD